MALQWGLILVKKDGNVIQGPNLQMQLFNDLITPLYPLRSREVQLESLDSLSGSALHAEPNLDIPRGDEKLLRGADTYDTMWYYTKVFGGKTEKLVRLSGHMEWRLTNLNATYDTIHKHRGKTIMVYTNLQQSNLVGSSNVQLLRQLVVSQGGGRPHLHETHPLGMATGLDASNGYRGSAAGRCGGESAAPPQWQESGDGLALANGIKTNQRVNGAYSSCRCTAITRPN